MTDVTQDRDQDEDGAAAQRLSQARLGEPQRW